MEEKSKGKKPFWLSTKGISLLGNKAILNPPNSNKIWNSMSRLDVYSFYFVSPLKSRLIEEWVFFFKPTNPWRNYFFFLSWSVASRATPVIRPPPLPFSSFSFFYPFVSFPPQWCQLRPLIEDQALLFHCRGPPTLTCWWQPEILLLTPAQSQHSLCRAVSGALVC